MSSLSTLGEFQPIEALAAKPAVAAEPERPEPERPEPAAEPERPERWPTDAVLRQAGALRARARTVQATARRWAVAVIAISTVITVFGSGNAHDVLAQHNTPEPWGWFLYPALEAGLIVEIQIGGALAEHGRRVRFWGGALRVVTAAAAVTVCVYGPAEDGDIGGAVLHALGPFVQFWLAEFLAAARAQFKTAAETLLQEAEDLLIRRPETECETGPTETRSHSKRTKVSPGVSRSKAPSKRRETARETARETKPAESKPRETKPKADPGKVSPIGDIEREVSQLIDLMRQRGGPDAVSLDRDVVPLLSHLSRATCDRRLAKARAQYHDQSKTA
ncbi:hypothetical protein [Streptomyces albus]|uniref:hypothetical protein n=1 Tax=Streptomyces sp. NRRL F-5917 TaxID=1463873 RepID=UPI0004C0D08C|nr:hypothetical protein [Streptomyces sp. NRRL F-5917]